MTEALKEKRYTPNVSAPESARDNSGKVVVGIIGASVVILLVLAGYHSVDEAGWIPHRATVLVSFEKGRQWMEGEARHCSLYPLKPIGMLYCEWLVSPPEGESHDLPVKFYGRVDRDKALPPEHNNWRCQRQKLGLLQSDVLTCWALD